MGVRRERVLVIVLAGGQGSRLEPLTRRRAKPAVSFAGQYRLIDIALSNVKNSGLEDVWVIEQYEPHSLNDHLANGRPWDLDRTRGGLRVLPPFERGASDGDDDEAMAKGNADAIFQNLAPIRQFAPDVVVTMSADHLCRLDLRDALDTHRERSAALTVVTTERPADDAASRFAWVSVEDGIVTGFEYKPEHPRGDRVCTETFVFDGETLLDTLGSFDDDDGSGIGDYGDRLLPRIVERHRVVEHSLSGYWRDLGTLGDFHRAHLELLEEPPGIVLDDPDWPFLTGSMTGAPSHVASGASVERCLLSPGVRVAGAVRDSVLGRGVVVEAGASVSGSVVLNDAVIRANATIENAIVDQGADVGADTTPIRNDDTDIRIYAGEDDGT